MKRSIRFALVGPVEAGKSTLFHALNGECGEVRKTQAVEYDAQGCIDTPGEFFSHPRLFSALINSISECDLLVYVHPANDLECRLPPGLLEIHANRRIAVVISKIDRPDAQPDSVEEVLREHGFVGDILRVCSLQPESVAQVRRQLGLNCGSAA